MVPKAIQWGTLISNSSWLHASRWAIGPWAWFKNDWAYLKGGAPEIGNL